MGCPIDWLPLRYVVATKGPADRTHVPGPLLEQLQLVLDLAHCDVVHLLCGADPAPVPWHALAALRPSQYNMGDASSTAFLRVSMAHHSSTLEQPAGCEGSTARPHDIAVRAVVLMHL